MCFFFSFMPATICVTVGFFALFAVSKTTETGLKMFGRVLAIWLFIIAAFILVAGAYASFSGLCPVPVS
jgi:hypothetical protein